MNSCALRCEYQENPIGIDIIRPRLSWQLRSDRRSATQSAYRIQAAFDPKQFYEQAGLLWDTGKMVSDQCIHREYEGPEVQSGRRYFWRVCAWDETATQGPWSEPAYWEMGLLHTSDWRARWIEPEGEIDPEAFKPCPCLRRSFTLGSTPVLSARAYVTSRGVYELSLNGKVVGDQVLAPGFTSYHKRLQYQTYDVTEHLRSGDNAVGAILGDGWYRGKTDALSFRNLYGKRLALLLQLHIRFADGTEQWVCSDEAWKTAVGPILKSDPKDGEIYDARREMPGWDRPGFDDRGWRLVQIAEHPLDALVASNGPAIRRHETFVPKVLHSPDGGIVLDMGQNIAGRVRFTVEGPAGTTVVLRHGETLDERGNFTLKNLNVSPLLHAIFKLDVLLQEVRYTLRGGGPETYEPRFTFQGFRYVRVEGFPGDPAPENFTGIALYSDMRPTGTFDCSHALVTRLHKNIEWSMKGNFIDIPTDCPQRERSGWTGDAQVFARTSSFIMETASFFRKWLADLAVDQRKDGMVPNVIPDPSLHTDAGVISRTNGSAGFSDAALIIPWTVFQCFGDERILAEQYESMKGLVDFMEHRARRIHWTKSLNPLFWLGAPAHHRFVYDTGYHWGEWQEPDRNPFLQMLKNFIFSQPQVATAYYVYSSGLLSRIARILGNEQDARRYAQLSEEVKEAWVNEFLRKNGRIRPDRQASYVRALAFDLLPEWARPLAVQRLVELIASSGYHIGTGFLSTPFICHVLSSNGRADVAYRLLLQQTIPSWLYPVTRGATTIWEFWNAIRPDGTVGMGSHNHYSPGSVGSWLYQVVAGIEVDPSCPGYKHFLILPMPGEGLSWASAVYQSPYGEIQSSWEIAKGRMRLSVRVPVNTSSTVRLPGADPDKVEENGAPLMSAEGVSEIRRDGRDTVCRMGAGFYQLDYPLG